MNYNSFKDKPFDERKKEAQLILKKYPEKIPIIMEKYDKHTPNLDRYKYLVSYDLTIGSLLLIIRKRAKLSEKQAIFIFANGSLYGVATSLAEVYIKEKNEDGFLYFTYSTENTFGN
jgi:GABA(A) receptor-associated protein